MLILLTLAVLAGLCLYGIALVEWVLRKAFP